MNLLLLARHEIDQGGRVRLVDRRAEHLRKVLKVQVGQTLKAGVLDGGRGEAQVLAVDPQSIDIELPLGLCQEQHLPTDRIAVDLIVALPRPQALHRLLQSVATMGVRRLDLVRSWRVEKSFFHSPSLAPEAIRKHLLLGAEQGMVTRLPQVEIHPQLRPFLDLCRDDLCRDDLCRDTAGPGRLTMLAHPGAVRSLDEVAMAALMATVTSPGDTHAAVTSVQIAIGPEGGWIDREVESFEKLGFQAVHLGDWILKVENALTACLAQWDVVRRWAKSEQRRRRDHGIDTLA